MRSRLSLAVVAAAFALVGAAQGARAAVYDITANETSAFGQEAIDIQLDTSDAVTSGAQTDFSNATVKVNGTLVSGGAFTTDTNNIGGSSFYFIDTDTPDTKAFYTGSGADIVFDPGHYVIADGATDGEGTLNISGGLVSAAPEPSTWLLMFAGIGGIGLMMRQAKRKMGFRFKDALAA